MYYMTLDEMETLLLNLRQIRQASGKMIATLEHLIQLQSNPPKNTVDYDPDDYLEQMLRLTDFMKNPPYAESEVDKFMLEERDCDGRN